MSPESELQCGAWLLSLGASFMFGSQAVLAWRRWKIQNAHFFIRLEYWATIILLVILGMLISLTPPGKIPRYFEEFFSTKEWFGVEFRFLKKLLKIHI